MLQQQNITLNLSENSSWGMLFSEAPKMDVLPPEIRRSNFLNSCRAFCPIAYPATLVAPSGNVYEGAYLPDINPSILPQISAITGCCLTITSSNITFNKKSTKVRRVQGGWREDETCVAIFCPHSHHLVASVHILEAT